MIRESPIPAASLPGREKPQEMERLQGHVLMGDLK
jgi:hypothetical protein